MKFVPFHQTQHIQVYLEGIPAHHTMVNIVKEGREGETKGKKAEPINTGHFRYLTL